MPTAKSNKKTTKKSVKNETKEAKVTESPLEIKVVAPPPPAVPMVVATPVKTEAEKIWEEIQHRSIQMFGLPEQFVYQHATFITVEPTSLYVTIRSSATLPSLEAAVSPDFSVELADKFVIIRRVPKPFVLPKRR